ncbi:MAG: sensor histidine kinase [Bacteroidia bacterium]|nr:sensor histidine kinase [Bacteroidia bacterium]
MKWLYNIINFGIREDFDYEDRVLIRKLNIIFYFGYFLILLAFIIENLNGISEFNFVFCSVLILAFAIPFQIYKGNFINALYTYFILSFLFFGILTVLMGIESNVIYFLIIMIFSLNNLLGSEKHIRHLKWFYISIFILLVVIYLLIFKSGKSYQIILPQNEFNFLRKYNILIFFVTAFSFGLFLTYESYLNDIKLKKLIKQKEILLAEVYHRVKNNLNIINSLLNLKKNSTESPEIKEVLEEFRQRIYAISSLYEKLIYKHDKAISISNYLHEIGKEFFSVYHNQSNRIKLNFNSDDIILSIDKAMPLGLIVNELLTNSLKHNMLNEKILKL